MLYCKKAAVTALQAMLSGVKATWPASSDRCTSVPVPDATQWDEIERVADWAYPVFEHLQHIAAQGEMIYQDDTSVRMLSLIAENRQVSAEGNAAGLSTRRTGMYTTALVVEQGPQTIYRYCSGRARAGQNLMTLWTQRGHRARQGHGPVGCAGGQCGGRRGADPLYLAHGQR